MSVCDILVEIRSYFGPDLTSLGFAPIKTSWVLTMLAVTLCPPSYHFISLSVFHHVNPLSLSLTATNEILFDTRVFIPHSVGGAEFNAEYGIRCIKTNVKCRPWFRAHSSVSTHAATKEVTQCSL